MNKSGQTALLSLMVGVIIFMLGMVFIAPLTDVITEARSDTQLNCSSAEISDGQKFTCLVVDLILPYFILTIISLAGMWITARIV